MNPYVGHPAAVAIVFLCMLALTLCQILGPTARLNRSWGTADLAAPVLATTSEHATRAHNPLPNRCASIKLAPVEIRTADFGPVESECGFIVPAAFTPLRGSDLGVPTPPPRHA
ncbi:MAG: hypothetical protein AB7S92_26020 [Parvibaculaceae bacterium]